MHSNRDRDGKYELDCQRGKGLLSSSQGFEIEQHILLDGIYHQPSSLQKEKGGTLVFSWVDGS